MSEGMDPLELKMVVDEKHKILYCELPKAGLKPYRFRTGKFFQKGKNFKWVEGTLSGLIQAKQI